MSSLGETDSHVAFYQFRTLSDLPGLRSFFLNWVSAWPSLRGKILISPEGFNGALSGPLEALCDFQKQIEEKLGWTGVPYRKSPAPGPAFKRFLVKIKKEIIPGETAPQEWTAPRLAPEALRAWIEEGRVFTLLDTRNDYEVAFGTFKGAEQLPLRHFRYFSKVLEAEKSRWDLDRPLVLFCTGGIRCEKASGVAAKAGFKEVYQLDGGILNYFETQGSAHYEGSCFVFDQRVALTPDLAPVPGSDWLPPRVVPEGETGIGGGGTIPTCWIEAGVLPKSSGGLARESLTSSPTITARG